MVEQAIVDLPKAAVDLPIVEARQGLQEMRQPKQYVSEACLERVRLEAKPGDAVVVFKARSMRLRRRRPAPLLHPGKRLDALVKNLMKAAMSVRAKEIVFLAHFDPPSVPILMDRERELLDQAAADVEEFERQLSVRPLVSGKIRKSIRKKMARRKLMTKRAVDKNIEDCKTWEAAAKVELRLRLNGL